MTTPTPTICAPWCSLPDLPISRKPIVTGDDPANDDAWEALCWQASEVLYAMTARQFSGRCESTVELREHRPRHRGWVAEAAFGAGVGDALMLPGTARVDRGRGATVAALPGRPVTEIVEVTVDGESAESGWVEADLSAGLLWRADGYPWPVDGSVTVTYKHGATPPVGGVRAAVTLALELGKAAMGDQSCALPQRVQTIQRQSVTVGFRDTFESLDSNRTGLWSVDAFVQSVNPKKFTAVPSVYSPDAARARRKVVP